MSVWVCFWQVKEKFEPYSPTFLLIVLAARLFGSEGEEGDESGILSAWQKNLHLVHTQKAVLLNLTN